MTVPLNTAPPEEDKVPEHLTDVLLVKVAVSPITIGDDEDRVPFVIVTEP